MKTKVVAEAVLVGRCSGQQGGGRTVDRDRIITAIRAEVEVAFLRYICSVLVYEDYPNLSH